MFIRKFGRARGGATAIEYAILASMIACALVAVLAVVGGNLSDVFGRSSDSISAAAPAS